MYWNKWMASAPYKIQSFIFPLFILIPNLGTDNSFTTLRISDIGRNPVNKLFKRVYINTTIHLH